MSYLAVIQVLLFGFLVQAFFDDDSPLAPPLANGTNAPTAEAPFMVSLNINGIHFCGGAIIDKQFVVTAAHCTKGLKGASSSFILTGTNSLSRGGVKYQIETFFDHPEWNETIPPTPDSVKALKADISLIKLKRPIKLNNVTKIIPLSTEEIPAGTTLTFTGWGVTSPHASRTPDLLQLLHVQALSNEDCDEVTNWNIGPSNLCAVARIGAGVLPGDSGSPLTYKGKVAGVASQAKSNVNLGFPSVYTRISHFHEWIRQTINENK